MPTPAWTSSAWARSPTPHAPPISRCRSPRSRAKRCSILRHLNPNSQTTIFAGKLHFSWTTESTNNDGLAAASRGARMALSILPMSRPRAAGAAITVGISAAGEGLYVSVLLRPQIPAARLPLLPLAAGLAAAEAIRTVSGLAVDLRWPNDLLIGPRKTGGILVEAQLSSKGLLHAIPPHAVVGRHRHQRTSAQLSLRPGHACHVARYCRWRATSVARRYSSPC